MKAGIISIVVCLLVTIANGKTVHRSEERLRRSGGEIAWGYKTWHNVVKPSKWVDHYSICGHKSQSPINIKKDEAERRIETEETEATDRLVLTKHDKITGVLTNNGHAPTLTLDDDVNVILTIEGGKKYKLKQFHFHFGCATGRGSEHEVDGKTYSGELHFVFYDASLGSFNAAAADEKDNGLTVVGVFLEVSEEDINEEFQKVVDKLADIQEEGSSTSLTDGIDIMKLSEQFEDSEYFSYSGSLTTPPCYQSVNWRVMKNPMTVSKQQIEEFRKLKAKHGHDGEMCDNYRPVQLINGRKIYVV